MEIATIFKDNLVVQPLPDAVEPRERILKLPSCTSLIYNADTKNSMEENSAIEVSITYIYVCMYIYIKLILHFQDQCII